MEREALRPILGKKYHSIPRDVNYWLFFKTHILEKETVRSNFEKNLTVKDFKVMVQKHANIKKYGPSYCRGSAKSEKTHKRNTSELLSVLWLYYCQLLHPDSPLEVRPSPTGGLGIYLKNNLEVEEGKILLKENLWGVACLLDNEDFTTLIEEKYPS